MEALIGILAGWLSLVILSGSLIAFFASLFTILLARKEIVGNQSYAFEESCYWSIRHFFTVSAYWRACHFFNVLCLRRKLIIAVMLATVAITAIYCYFERPIYSAT